MKVLLAIALVLGSITLVPAAAASLPASPSPTTVAPASPELVAWALAWRKAATGALKRHNRARACFGLARVALKPARPLRSASSEEWREAGRAWKKARYAYREKTIRLRYRMIHPGGSGWERWRPLVRWHWPGTLVNTAIQVIRYESGGNPRARNASSGAAGLFQLLPAPDGWANPDINVWYAYHRKYVPAGGWSPWYSCAAF